VRSSFVLSEQHLSMAWWICFGKQIDQMCRHLWKSQTDSTIAFLHHSAARQFAAMQQLHEGHFGKLARSQPNTTQPQHCRGLWQFKTEPGAPVVGTRPKTCLRGRGLEHSDEGEGAGQLKGEKKAGAAGERVPRGLRCWNEHTPSAKVGAAESEMFVFHCWFPWGHHPFSPLKHSFDDLATRLCFAFCAESDCTLLTFQQHKWGRHEEGAAMLAPTTSSYSRDAAILRFSNDDYVSNKKYGLNWHRATNRRKKIL
jgi:hypothetical protein